MAFRRFLAHLAVTAFRAPSLRSSAVMLAALAWPPFSPPFLPILARYSRISAGSFVMSSLYMSGLGKASGIFQIPLDLRKRLMYDRDMNRLPDEKQAAILNAHFEGMSMRSIGRMTGVHRDTIVRLIVGAGERCAAFLDARIRNVRARRVQMDEIWTFVFKKQARLTITDDETVRGDQYVFV